MNNFWTGFEKRAGVTRKALKGLGNLTGARQFRTGMRQLAHEQKRRGATVGGGKFFTRQGYGGRMRSAGKNLSTGTKRLAGTTAVGGAGLLGAAALSGNKKEKL